MQKTLADHFKTDAQMSLYDHFRRDTAGAVSILILAVVAIPLALRKLGLI